MFTPIALKAFNVFKTSSDKRIFDICETPFEIDGIIIDLCEIDLSPGILILPLIPSVIFEEIRQFIHALEG